MFHETLVDLAPLKQIEPHFELANKLTSFKQVAKVAECRTTAVEIPSNFDRLHWIGRKLQRKHIISSFWILRETTTSQKDPSRMSLRRRRGVAH